jgi:hypothetical protein
LKCESVWLEAQPQKHCPPQSSTQKRSPPRDSARKH